MTPNEEAIASTFIAQFAARSDAYAVWGGEHWSCVRRELGPADVVAALAGKGPSLSGYTIRPDGMTHVGAFDFDLPDGMALARRVRSAMAARGATGYVEPSRRGCHLWVLPDRELPARTVRRALRAFLADAGVAEDPKIELRPAGDTIREDGVGFPIRLPTMPHPKTGLRYPLLDADDKPLSPRLDAMLLAIDWTPASVLVDAAMRFVPPVSELSRDYFPPRAIRPAEAVESITDVLRELYSAPRAIPGRAMICVFHPDHNPSLSIADDDERCFCKSPSCWAWNDGRGRGPAEVRRHHATG